MQSERRIGLLVGLIFIVGFALVLTELTGTRQIVPVRAVAEPPVRDVGDLAGDIRPAGLPSHVREAPAEAAGNPRAESVVRSSLRPPRTDRDSRVAVTRMRRERAPELTGNAGATRTPGGDTAGNAVAGLQTPPDPERGYREMDLDELGSHFARAPSGRAYVVRRGDNLTKIARRMLNDDSRAAVMRIFQANADKLTDPDNLPVGVELRIPSG